MNRHLLFFLLFFSTFGSMAQSWPRFRNNLEQTGYTSTQGPVIKDVMWEFWQNVQPLISSPAVVDDKVYFGSMDSVLYCLDRNTGIPVWTYKTNGPIYYSSPAVENNRVYIGSYDGYLHCVDATNGQGLWSFNTGATGGFNSCPAVSDGKVYFGANNFNVYCLNAETGEFIWSFLTGSQVWCSPAVVDNRVYIGSFDSRMYCLNATTGERIWDVSTPMMVYSSPAVYDGKLYFGTVVGGNCYCLNINDGSVVWQRSLNGAIFSSPAVHNGRLFIGVDQNALMRGAMYCLDAATGDSIWSIYHENYGSVYSSPAVTDSLIFYGTMNNNAYCIRQSDGSLVWEQAFTNQVLMSPAVADGRVYFSSKDGQMLCIAIDVSAKNYSLKDGLRIYPNPTMTDATTISFNVSSPCKVRLEIFDTYGRMVYNEDNISCEAGDNNVSLKTLGSDGISLIPGMYVCNVIAPNKRMTGKLLIN